ncbi:hypothetical protein ACFLQL_01825 [Verrucomicrobiota bacterium]
MKKNKSKKIRNHKSKFHVQAADKVRYGLRFQILPNQLAVQQAKEVVEFCIRHRAESVHLFFNAEEWNRGHVTETELRRLLEMYEKIIPLFRRAGLGVSLNPWSTTLHTERGRSLRSGQNFQTMVSPSGMKSKAIASFACPRWRKYIADLYGRMAKLGFDVLWLEDDFRYHNHEPLDWGGDFSPAMLKLFSARIGRKVSRPELLKKVLQSGNPHPWRALWLGLWRECSERAAGAIRDAVARANPGAKLGLMSSNPDMHAVEGRDWNGLFRALAINGKTWHRPHFAAYSDVEEACLLHGYSLLDEQRRFRPAWVESHPEIENSPFSRFRKSDTQTFMQMALAKIMGSEGLLLDLHPVTGNSVFDEPGIGAMLSRSYPALAWLGRHFNREMTSRGIGVPCFPSAPLKRRLPAGVPFDRLFAFSINPGYVLGRCGIAYQRDFSLSGNVIWGNNAWGLTDEQVRKCLGGGLWLDAEAAEILVKRGYGKHLGITIKGWLERDKSLYTLERIVSPKTGVRAGFNLSCNRMDRVLQIEGGRKSEIWTDLIDCFDRRMGAALSVHRNSIGGTVAVSAFAMAEDWPNWNMNYQRQTLIQSLVKNLAGRNNVPAFVLRTPRCLVIDQARASERRMVVINMAPDPAVPEVFVPRARKLKETTFILPVQKPFKGRVQVISKGGGLIVKPGIELPFGGIMVLSLD